MLRGKRGFTLIEVTIVLVITALILPAIGLAFYQLLRVPPQETNELTAINAVSLALGWIDRDGMMAQSFSSAHDYNASDAEHLYGGFYWVDRTEGNISHCYATRYYYDDDNDRLIREVWKDNELISPIIIARHIAYYGNVSFEFHPHGDWPAGNFSGLGLPYVVVTIKTTEGQGNAAQRAEGTHYVHIRGSETLSRGFAILTRGTGGYTLDISGYDLTIDGDIRSHGGISISDGDHTINGTAQAAWLIEDDDDAIDDAKEDQHAVLHAIGWNMVLEDFLDPQNPGDNEYVFSGNVSLDWPAPAGYWLDATTLKPGVYYTPNGTITLATNNASGMVTLIGDKVKVTADYTELTPFCNGVLLYTTGEGKEAEFSGEGGTWYGTLFAPDGRVKMTGSGLSLYGAIAAQTFIYTGDGIKIWF